MKIFRFFSLFGPGLVFLSLFNSCSEKKPEDVVVPEQSGSDLPLAPANPVAPEAPVSIESYELTPERDVAGKAKSKSMRGKKSKGKKRTPK